MFYNIFYTTISDLYVEGALQTSHDWTAQSAFTNARVSLDADTNTYSMAFDNNIVAMIKVDFELKMMVVSMVMDPSLKTKVSGLMGNSRASLYNTV